MQTQTQSYLWEASLECTEYAHEDRFFVDVHAADILVELTREDLESMLSALDDLEAD